MGIPEGAEIVVELGGAERQHRLRAADAVGRSIAALRETVSGWKAVFLAFCT
ncbi:MAG: hypothetical protein ACUVTW_11750 [Thermogutta sp.]